MTLITDMLLYLPSGSFGRGAFRTSWPVRVGVGQQCGPTCCPSAAPAGSQKTPCRLPAHHRSFIYSFPSGSTFSVVATFYCNIVLDGKIINTPDTTLSFGRPPKGVEWCWCGSSVVFMSKSGVFLMPPLPLTAGKGQVDATGNLLMPQHNSVGPSRFQRTAVFTHVANTSRFQSGVEPWSKWSKRAHDSQHSKREITIQLSLCLETLVWH